MRKYKTSDLKHRIFIQRDSALGTTDSNGNPAAPAWESITEKVIWAGKKGLTGTTFFAAAATHSEDNILFVVRYNAKTKTVTTAMRIVEGITVTDGAEAYDHIYEITAPPVDVGDRHEWLEIHAKEVEINGG
jgi:SPP1 family predicted phage head-tail adaptor